SERLAIQARQIADTWVRQINQSGQDYVVNEIEEHLSPDVSNLFIRLTRADGSLLYQSKPPRDGSFDPSAVTAVNPPPRVPGSRKQHLAGTELIIYTLPYSAPDAGSFLIEVGTPYRPIESTLHGLVLIFALSLPIALALAIGVGYILIRRALIPVDAI